MKRNEKTKLKLRKKETGQTGYLFTDKNKDYKIFDENDNIIAVYPMLAELMQEWEDYQDGDRVYYITYTGEVDEILAELIHPEISLKMKKIGNWFETKEEAEEAVKKLNAWKRLKDNSWRPAYHRVLTSEADVLFNTVYTITQQDRTDLGLLFGWRKK